MSAPSPPKRDIQWADGIRGIACILVVMAHGFESYAYPRDSFDARPYLFGLPIFKLVFEGGYLAVPIFFILSGYVCAMKPLKLMRAGKVDDARKVIASSGFRRLIRLGIPATIAVTCSWFLCQAGGFRMATSLPGDCWLHFHSAYPVVGFWNSFTRLVKAILHTWTYDGETWATQRNIFEGIQWTLAIEYHGSMMLFLLLTITAAFTTYTRRLLFYIVIAYGVYNGDLLGEIPFFSGALLADLSLYLNSPDASTARSWGHKFPKLVRDWWPMALGIFGLTVGSYPAVSPENSAWSRFMTNIGFRIFHPHWECRWAFAFIGAYILIFAIHFSPGLRRLFSHPIVVFYGSISFPLYLIHGFLMRSVLVWVVFGVLPPAPEGTGWYIWAILRLATFASWFAMVTYLSMLWRDRVDKISMRAAQWSEEYMLGKKSFPDLFGAVGHISQKAEGLASSNGYDEKRPVKETHPV